MIPILPGIIRVIKKLKFELLEISVYKYIKLITMLQHYIKSFRKGLWDNKCLPAKWIAWRIILGQLHPDRGYTFMAFNAQEYIDAIRDKLPYLDDSDLQFLYDKINKKTRHTCYFAGPSLIVDNSYHNLATGKTREHIEGKWELVDDKYFLICYGSVDRLPSSYADNQLHGEGRYHKLAFSEKAMSYAREQKNIFLQSGMYKFYMYEFS